MCTLILEAITQYFHNKTFLERQAGLVLSALPCFICLAKYSFIRTKTQEAKIAY